MAISARSSGVGILIKAKNTSNAIGKLASISNDVKVIKVSGPDITDIRRHTVTVDLKEEILESLRPFKGPKTLPTLLLYDEKGLQLFEKITYLPEYYLTNAEIDILRNSAHEIAHNIPFGAMLVELGSGNLRKVSILLQVLEDAAKDVDYYALDLSLAELKRTLEQVPSFKYVKCHGLHGTYDDGLNWLQLPENRSRPKFVMSLGSSIGNFKRHEAPEFLRSFSDVLQSSDCVLVGLDSTSDAAKVYHAYNDHEGITHKFILNGLQQANQILGEGIFQTADWEVIGEYVYDDQGGRHQAFYSPTCDFQYQDIHIKAGERIQVEQSLKYSASEVAQLWRGSGLREVKRWLASSDAYALHLLTKQDMDFNANPAVYAASPIPTLDDWRDAWAMWDTVTRDMIPKEQLNEKPIKLRNAFIFYLGHIPTFLDLQLSRVTGKALCQPSYYARIFERGVDPDVDNPENCHAHSVIPDTWPPVDEIWAYQDQVREKVRGLYKTHNMTRDVARAVWIGFEHEIMHLETLLYMLLQSDKILPPTNMVPDFAAEVKIAEAGRVPNEWFEIPEQAITLGLDDPEDNSSSGHFGWDNEKPRRLVNVPAFKAQARPLSNDDYARYLIQSCNSKIPASWAEKQIKQSNKNGLSLSGHKNGASNGVRNQRSHENRGPTEAISNQVVKDFLEGKYVRTVYGLTPLKYALDWPVYASYDELAGCARWMDGRIPTLEEARSIYSYVDRLRLKEAEQHLGKTVPAVNGQLSNNGVEETPPTRPSTNGLSSQELFANLEGANVGFKNWHPVPVTANGSKLSGQADMGGVWEWTSSTLAKYDGFEPTKLYPAYTADFFDEKHNIVLGGSWATHPRIAGRKTFVNWYQRNYPYVWAGVRLVRDL